MISTKIRYKQYSNTTGVISSVLGLSRALFSMTPADCQWYRWNGVLEFTVNTLWVVSPLQCRSSILVFIHFIHVIYVTNHQNHCKCKMQMSVILCSHGLLDLFNKTILYSMPILLMRRILRQVEQFNLDCFIKFLQGQFYARPFEDGRARCSR
jgi:hypothetical protein